MQQNTHLIINHTVRIPVGTAQLTNVTKWPQTTILTVYLDSDSPDSTWPHADADACPAVVKFTVSEWWADNVSEAAGQTTCYRHTI